jgi:hypothetical protein
MGGLEEFLPAIAEMLQHPPDPNAPLPLANRHGVIYGVTIPFLVSSSQSPARRASLTNLDLELDCRGLSATHATSSRS